MITVTYLRHKHLLQVKGHAGFAQRGQDPVCAGVSSLVLTLAANVAELVSWSFATAPVLRLENGFARIRCRPKQGRRPIVTLVYDTVCTGFALLHTLYPEYVCYRVFTGEKPRQKEDSQSVAG